jgi:FKBP-type peptidyl-prolyl cis-trans isomerase FklB
MVKHYLITGLAAVTLLPALSLAASAPALKSQADKLSYAMGYTTGQALRNHGIQLSMDAYSSGIKTGLANGKPALNQQQMAQTLQSFQKQQIKKMTKQRVTEAVKNQKDGEAFLAKNKKRSGVKITPDGLQYKVITPGKGQSPTLADSVTVNYEGKLINGTVFDSSYKRNKPITFPLGGVIKGWQQALVMMKPGATWQVVIPANLAYGATGVPGSDIGPNETLIFKINLVSVNQGKQ